MADGRAVMVDVGAKAETLRVAVARGRIKLSAEARRRIATGTAEKGDVLATARIAAIMAAKKTAELIPLCHPLPLTAATVRFRMQPAAVEVEATVRCRGRTGVEMEALTAVAAACLTIYDMTKAYGRGHTISDCRLVAKSGGRSGDWRGEGERPWPDPPDPCTDSASGS